MTPAGWLISSVTLAASLLGPTAVMSQERPTAGQSRTTDSAQRSDGRTREIPRQRRDRVRLTFPPPKR